jgi:surfeit locus 1 family protein
LIGLGTWQLRRLAWKEGILREIAEAEAGPAAPLVDAAAPYAKVATHGRFLTDRVALYGSEARPTQAGVELGAHQIVPLALDGRDAAVLVDRGWLPTTHAPAIAVPTSDVAVEGYVRPPETRGPFSAVDDALHRRFFVLDPSVIGAALGVGPVLPFTLVALGTPEPQRFPIPAATLPRPANDHLGYALTWFSLAGALVVMFTLWCRKVLRS